MGVMYALTDRQRNIRYELGKGGWASLNDYTDAPVVVNDNLVPKIKEVVDDAQRIVDELKIVFGVEAEVQLENDVSDDFYDLEIRGSRYTHDSAGRPCAIDVTQWAVKDSK